MFASVVDMEDGTYWLSLALEDGETLVSIGPGKEIKSLVESIAERINKHIETLVKDERAKLCFELSREDY